MVRPGFAALWVLVAMAGTPRAADLPRYAGLYQGTSALPMVDSKVEVTVRGPIVEAVVTQRFTNPGDHATEATYIFPLPADAAVTAMSIKTGNRTIKAAIERRDDAQRRYEAAVSSGVGAALLDQERPDVFTQTVSAIAPHASVEITLRYDTVAVYRGGTWEIVLPLVVAPRFVPGTASGLPTTGTGRAPDTNRAPDASRVTPNTSPGAGGPTRIQLAFPTGAESVASPTHEIAGGGIEYTLIDPKSDHDAVIRWHASLPANGWVEQDDDGGYAAVVVEAGKPKPAHGAIRCTVVLDRAATTRGDAAAIERPFVRALLAAFDPQSKLAVIGSDAIAWTTPEQAARAIDAGWTRTPGPFDLTRTLKAARPDGAPLVLISDGLVADDTAAIAAARAVGVPVHVIGIGPAPARGLLSQIATSTGGTLRFATPGDDVAALAKDVAIDLATPPAPLAVSWGTLAASDVVPAMLPRLGTGQALLVLARVPRAQRANARARGDVFAIEPLKPQRAIEGAVTPRGALARRWARNRLDELVLARAAAPQVAAHAIRYALVSPYTSMVAVGTEVVVQGGVTRSVAVPVSVPAGMRWQPVKRELAVDTTLEVSQNKERNIPVPKAPTLPPPGAKGTPAPDTAKDGKKDRAHREAEEREEAAKSTKTKKAGKDKYKSKDDDRDGVDSDDKPAKKHSDDSDEDASDRHTRNKHDRDDRKNKNAKGGDDEAPVATGRTFGSDVTATAPEPMRDVGGESLQVTGMASENRLRLTASLGGGVAFRGSADGLVAVDGRAEIGGRTLVGLDAGLWLVGSNLSPQGRFLLTVARRGIARYVELGIGGGLHLGDGAGPALSLRMRVRLPWSEHAAPFLRYDGALLYHDGTKTGENAATLGVEWSW